jgi:hypothetical protein
VNPTPPGVNGTVGVVEILVFLARQEINGGPALSRSFGICDNPSTRSRQ